VTKGMRLFRKTMRNKGLAAKYELGTCQTHRRPKFRINGCTLACNEERGVTFKEFKVRLRFESLVKGGNGDQDFRGLYHWMEGNRQLFHVPEWKAEKRRTSTTTDDKDKMGKQRFNNLGQNKRPGGRKKWQKERKKRTSSTSRERKKKSGIVNKETKRHHLAYWPSEGHQKNVL